MALTLRVSRCVLVVVSVLSGAVCMQAQGPTAQPYTMTTVAGGLVPTNYTAGSTLCPGSTTVKATTAYGDGCAAIAASFGAGGRGGVAVDSFGNIFVADDVNKIAHVIDAETGVMSVLAGGGTACAAKIDSLGDGCVAATQTSFSAASALRGIGSDPYGNVLLAGYNDNAIHIVCRAASPLCTTGTPSPTAATPSVTQVGNMGLVAGCMASTTGYGTAGVGLDNKPGFSTSANSLAAFKNSGTCTTALDEASGPRGATADLYGNVYYADTGTSRTRVVLGPLTSSYFTGANPLYAALKTHWNAPTAGYVYTVFNLGGTSTTSSTAATTTGAACTDASSGTTYTGTAADTYIAPELTGPNGVAQTLPYGTPATVDVILTPAVGGAPYPTGAATLTDATSGNTFTGTFNGTADTISITVPVSDLSLGAHTFNVSSYSGDANYTVAAFGSYVVTVVKATPTITTAPTASAITYGQTLAISTLSGGAASVAGTFAFTTPSTAPAAGTSQQSVTFTPTDTTDYTTVTTMVSVTTKQAAPTVILTASPNPSVLSNAVTLTAAVKSSVGTPTGTITFYSTSSGGTVTLGTVTLPLATITVTTLPVGTSNLTAVYSGDANFASVTSAAVQQQVYDFTLTATTPSQTVGAGAVATFGFTLTPGSSTFLLPVNLSVSGLPTGTIYAITPSSVAAGSGASTLTLTAYIPAHALNQAPVHPFGWPRAPIVLALLLLPISARLRRSGRRLGLSILLLLLSSAAIGAISGCGSSTTSSFSPQTYTVTVTATSGTLSHTANVTLNVQ